MKVLHVIAHLDPGGTERQLVGTILAAHGVHWDATLCVLNPGYRLTGEVAAAGVPTVELEQRRRRDFGRIARLREVVRETGVDVVHSSLWRGNAVTRLAAAYRGRPAVVVAERAVEDERPWRDQLVDRALRPVTDGYIGNSEAVRSFIVRTHHVAPDRVVVVGNGVDTSVFHPAGRADERQPPWRIGSVGRLEHQKGYDVLLAALPAVLAEHDVTVDVVGAGSLAAELEGLASGLPVRFRGFFDQPADVAAFLHGLDLFVLPSRFEGLPNAVLEAVACGVPVVGTDVPGMREAVGPDATLVAPDEPQALAGAISKALAEPERSVAAPRASSFDDVARRHRVAFDLAVGRRATGAGPR